ELTEARLAALTAVSRLKPTTILEDAKVPRSEIPKMVKAINEIADKYQVTICTFGHACEGNLYLSCLTDERDEAEISFVMLVFEEIFKEAAFLGCTITGEHVVGMMKLPYLHLKTGEAGLEAMRAIKKALDPNNIMNPGKMLLLEEEAEVN